MKLSQLKILFKQIKIILCLVFLIGCDNNDDFQKLNVVNVLDISFSGSGKAVVETSAGGYIITGSHYSNALLIKLNSSGEEEWIHIFEDSLLYASITGNSVAETHDGGFVITGKMRRVSVFRDDLWISKTDVNGNEIWKKIYSLSESWSEEGNTIRPTSDGGYIVVGSNQDMWGSNVWLLKTDSLGDLEWTETYGVEQGSNTCNDKGNSVQITDDGGYIIAGVTGCFANCQIYLIKTDASGNVEWQQDFGDIDYDWGYWVSKTADGGYILTGTIGQTEVRLNRTTPYQNAKIHSLLESAGRLSLIKTDHNGNTDWGTSFENSTIQIGRYVQQTQDGGYFIVGSIVFKTNSKGKQKWRIDDLQGYSGFQSADGGFVILSGNRLLKYIVE